MELNGACSSLLQPSLDNCLWVASKLRGILSHQLIKSGMDQRNGGADATLRCGADLSYREDKIAVEQEFVHERPVNDLIAFHITLPS